MTAGQARRDYAAFFSSSCCCASSDGRAQVRMCPADVFVSLADAATTQRCTLGASNKKGEGGGKYRSCSSSRWRRE